MADDDALECASSSAGDAEGLLEDVFLRQGVLVLNQLRLFSPQCSLLYPSILQSSVKRLLVLSSFKQFNSIGL